MQAYSRTSDKPQIKRFKKETRYTHHRSEGLRGKRGTPNERRAAGIFDTGRPSNRYTSQD